MSRREFIEELERLLADLPEEERKAAVQYYEDYFEDAGAEHEADVIRELGGPEKTAASIRADYYGTEFREEEYDNKAYMEKYGQGSRRREENAGWNGGTDHTANDSGRQDAAGNGAGAWSEADSRHEDPSGGAACSGSDSVVVACPPGNPWVPGWSGVCLYRHFCRTGHRICGGNDRRHYHDRCGSCIGNPVSACGISHRRYRHVAVCTGNGGNSGNGEALRDRVSGHVQRICESVQKAILREGGVIVL